MKPNRILHIVSAMDRGGAEILIMNVYRNLNRSDVQFDFIVHKREQSDFDDEIESLGGNIYRIQSLGQLGPIPYIKQLGKIMKANHYMAVHAHTDYQSGFPALAAKFSGIKKRICHAHSSSWPKRKDPRWKMTFRLLQNIIRYSATDYCACSKEAAQFLFGQKTVYKGKVHVLKNGIELTPFMDMDLESSASVKHEFKIPAEARIIGHIGRFSESKNHMFILKVLQHLLEQQNNLVAILVGDGPLRKNIEEEAKRLGISDHIRFTGIRTDIPRLTKAFDVFLFPSLFEGFGIVTLEAQSAGTPCIVSDTVPKSTDMGLGLMSFIGLNEPMQIWAQEIKKAMLKERPGQNLILNQVSKLGFNIKHNIPQWLELYGLNDPTISA